MTWVINYCFFSCYLYFKLNWRDILVSLITVSCKRGILFFINKKITAMQLLLQQALPEQFNRLFLHVVIMCCFNLSPKWTGFTIPSLPALVCCCNDVTFFDRFCFGNNTMAQASQLFTNKIYWWISAAIIDQQATFYTTFSWFNTSRRAWKVSISFPTLQLSFLWGGRSFIFLFYFCEKQYLFLKVTWNEHTNAAYFSSSYGNPICHRRMKSISNFLLRSPPHPQPLPSLIRSSVRN